MGPGKSLLRKTRSLADEFASTCEGKPVGRPSRPSFRVPLRGRLPVLHWLPFARLPSSLLLGRNGVGKLRFNPWALCHVAASYRSPLFGVAPSADSCLGPLSDLLGTHCYTYESYFGLLCGPRSKVAPRTAKWRIAPSRQLP